MTDRVAGRFVKRKRRPAAQIARHGIAAVIAPKEGFDWRHVVWGRPDSPPSVLCSYCSALLPDACGERSVADDVPLMLFSEEGYGAQFCQRCQWRWFGMR